MFVDDFFENEDDLFAGDRIGYHKEKQKITRARHDPQYACEYARDVIKGRWPEVEDYALVKNSFWAWIYARDVIGGRWPEAEPYIMQHPAWAYEYARDVIKARWPEAEPVIAQYRSWTKDYKQHFGIKGKLTEADDDLFADTKTEKVAKALLGYAAELKSDYEAADPSWEDHWSQQRVINKIDYAKRLADMFRSPNGMIRALNTIANNLNDRDAPMFKREAIWDADDYIQDKIGFGWAELFQTYEDQLDESTDEFAPSKRVSQDIRNSRHPFGSLGVTYEDYEQLVDLIDHCSTMITVRPDDLEEMVEIFMSTLGQRYGGAAVYDVIEDIIPGRKAIHDPRTLEELRSAFEADHQQGYLKPDKAVAKLDLEMGKAMYAVEDASNEQSLKPWGRDRELDENDDDLFAKGRDNVHDLSDYDDSTVYDLTQSSENIRSGDILKLDNGRWAIMVDYSPVMVVGDSNSLHRLDTDGGYTFDNIEGGRFAKSAAKARLLATKPSINENNDDLFAPSDRLKQVMQIRNSPLRALDYAKDVIGGRWPEAEFVIMRRPERAYEYARDVIKGRWLEAEPVIMKSPIWAFYYAKDVIKGRWPEAEPYIMKNPEWAYWYARKIIRRRWAKAEPRIMKNPEWAYSYARDVFKGRWPEAEPVIMRDPREAMRYARDVIKGRWLEAEPVIRQSEWEKIYRWHFNMRGKLKENDDDLFAEPTIRFDQAFNEYDEDELQKMGFAYGDHPELDVEIINNYIRGHQKWRVLKITGGEHDLTLHLDKLSGLREDDDDLFAERWYSDDQVKDLIRKCFTNKQIGNGVAREWLGLLPDPSAYSKEEVTDINNDYAERNDIPFKFVDWKWNTAHDELLWLLRGAVPRLNETDEYEYDDDLFAPSTLQHLPYIIDNIKYTAEKLLEEPLEFLAGDLNWEIADDEDEDRALEDCMQAGAQLQAIVQAFRDGGVGFGMKKLYDMYQNSTAIGNEVASMILDEINDECGIRPDPYLNEADDTDELFAPSKTLRVIQALSNQVGDRKNWLTRNEDNPNVDVVYIDAAKRGIVIVGEMITALRTRDFGAAAKIWGEGFYARAYSGMPGAAELADEGLHISHQVRDETDVDFLGLYHSRDRGLQEESEEADELFARSRRGSLGEFIRSGRPSDIYRWAKEYNTRLVPAAESILLNNLNSNYTIDYAFQYARDVLHSAWPELERVVLSVKTKPARLKLVSDLLYYANINQDTKNFVKSIAYTWKLPTFAARFAAQFMRDKRWPEAESLIIKDSYDSISYAHYNIGGRWPEAEPIIMRSGRAAGEYAASVLKARWPEAEPVIAGNNVAWSMYYRDVVRAGDKTWKGNNSPVGRAERDALQSSIVSDHLLDQLTNEAIDDMFSAKSTVKIPCLVFSGHSEFVNSRAFKRIIDEAIRNGIINKILGTHSNDQGETVDVYFTSNHEYAADNLFANTDNGGDYYGLLRSTWDPIRKRPIVLDENDSLFAASNRLQDVKLLSLVKSWATGDRAQQLELEEIINDQYGFAISRLEGPYVAAGDYHDIELYDEGTGTTLYFTDRNGPIEPSTNPSYLDENQDDMFAPSKRIKTIEAIKQVLNGGYNFYMQQYNDADAADDNVRHKIGELVSDFDFLRSELDRGNLKAFFNGLDMVDTDVIDTIDADLAVKHKIYLHDLEDTFLNENDDDLFAKRTVVNPVSLARGIAQVAEEFEDRADRVSTWESAESYRDDAAVLRFAARALGSGLRACMSELTAIEDPNSWDYLIEVLQQDFDIDLSSLYDQYENGELSESDDMFSNNSLRDRLAEFMRNFAHNCEVSASVADEEFVDDELARADAAANIAEAFEQLGLQAGIHAFIEFNEQDGDYPAEELEEEMGITLDNLIDMLPSDISESDDMFAASKQSDLSKINSGALIHHLHIIGKDIRAEYASAHKAQATRIKLELERRGIHVPYGITENDDEFSSKTNLTSGVEYKKRLVATVVTELLRTNPHINSEDVTTWEEILDRLDTNNDLYHQIHSIATGNNNLLKRGFVSRVEQAIHTERGDGSIVYEMVDQFAADLDKL